mmetsp:Transcript_40893/g.85770  ORF Transcript_40893/g.85770 Transcript_40893/m.85770 type:complete len:437 (-) Transcript_40893:90-1400(-)
MIDIRDFFSLLFFRATSSAWRFVILHTPKVKLQFPHARRASVERVVRSLFQCNLVARLEGGVIYRLEDGLVQLLRLRGRKRQAQSQESVRQARYADPDGPVTAVGLLGALNRILIHVDHLVQILGHYFRHFVQLLVVKVSLSRLGGSVSASFADHELGQADARQVAYRDFLIVRILNDLRAKITALNRTQIFLIALLIRCILVKQIRRARLDLSIQYRRPQRASSNLTRVPPLPLVLFVQPLELLPVRLGQSGTLVRTHQTPIPVLLHPLHEQIGHPQSVEQIPRPLLFLPVILPQIQHVEDVGVPRLDVDGEGAGTLPPALVDVVGGGVVDAQHRDEAVGDAARALDEGSAGADFIDAESDAAGSLGNHSTTLQRIVNPINRIIAHLHQKTTAQLRMGRPRMKQGRTRVSEIPRTHQIISFEGGGEIRIFFLPAQ